MSTTDLPGSGLLAGRYRLVERLGAGGMSVVWRGFDEVLGRQVAVKVLPPSTSADPSFRRRLRAEAQAAARLSHPHITNVYDYGEATTVDGEPVPYVVMELVDGESLAAVLSRARTLPWNTAVRISADVAAALAAAHARGIVHRDVTPANVMLTAAGAKVVDFGISALIGENDTDPDGSLLGTPAYLAPERLEGGQVSPATDVYAVGLLIYRMLIGQLPWDVGTTTALLRAHQYTEPEPLPPVDGLPAEVDALIGRCLEKRPADRPPTAEVAHLLAGIAAGAPPAQVSGFPEDWADSGENTTILPSGYPYAGMGPAAAAADPAPKPPPPLRPGSAAEPAPAERPPARSPKQVRTRRILVVAGTIAVLTALTYGWSLAAPGKPDERANAVPAGPSVMAAAGGCIVSYAVWSQEKNRFKAQVTVANRGEAPVDDWRLWFLMNGDQVVKGKGAVDLKQNLRAVTVTSAGPLQPQESTTMEITGRYTQSNAAPMVFQLNGKNCEAFVSSEPGAPSRPVEQLSDGTIRFGAPATDSPPQPGISIDPGGIVHITPTTTSAAPGKPGTTTTTPVPGSSNSSAPIGGGNGNGNGGPTSGPTTTIAPEPHDSVGPSTPTTTSATPTDPVTTPTTPDLPPDDELDGDTTT
ncbi:serine/threonine-protein kinase [Actinoplanes octamycinicus]|uniref:non-specific serine/threonine protein kinase n=1 Tax=Actinoplanes octamycinicus TaxID=135948 RepID=A0A7W7H8F8_9ACTN|nr:serine/threonine-protein kinase [Actinoplanes octamycinicus]MBB4745522.1 serine/threonine-protein kinase [Actinoplanes octamycinicus]